MEIRYLRVTIINRVQLETGEIIQRTANEESTFFRFQSNAPIKYIFILVGVFKLIVMEKSDIST